MFKLALVQIRPYMWGVHGQNISMILGLVGLLMSPKFEVKLALIQIGLYLGGIWGQNISLSTNFLDFN